MSLEPLFGSVGIRILRKRVSEVEKSIADVVDRAANAGNPRVIASYENRIAELERQKFVLEERARNSGKPRMSFGQVFELPVRFLSNPCKIWNSGQLELQKLVLKLAFAEHLSYCRETGFRTPKKTIPFNVLGVISEGGEMDGAAGEI
ncbi:MAG: hypothetical protein AAF713_22270 [Pseudomonadota bacterium]